MAKINLQRLQAGGRHTVKVILNFESDNGAGKSTETMRVVYRGISLLEGQEIEDKINSATAETRREALIEALSNSVLDLPDIEENGAAVKPDREFFATLDTYYLNRINQAIQDDRSGNG